MNQRLKNIDVLRGIAVLFVFARHHDQQFAHFGWINSILSFLQRGVWVGVDLFFVLSGFLIAGLLFGEYNRHGRINFAHFFMRRGFKIYPSYYLMISITLLAIIILQKPISAAALTPFFVFLQNYAYDPAPGIFNLNKIWGPTWSLAVEEHFYIFLPILFIGLSPTVTGENDPFYKIPWLFLFIGILCLTLRFAKSSAEPFHFLVYVAPTHMRIDALLFGVLIAYYYVYHRGDLKRVSGFFGPVVMSLIGVFLLFPAFVFELWGTRFMYTAGFSLVYLGCGLILISVLLTDDKGGWFLEGLQFVGRHSYPIYLWHMPFKTMSDSMNTLYPSGLLYLTTYLIAPMVVGVAMSKWIEAPMLRLRDRLLPSRS